MVQKLAKYEPAKVQHWILMNKFPILKAVAC